MANSPFKCPHCGSTGPFELDSYCVVVVDEDGDVTLKYWYEGQDGWDEGEFGDEHIQCGTTMSDPTKTSGCMNDGKIRDFLVKKETA